MSIIRSSDIRKRAGDKAHFCVPVPGQTSQLWIDWINCSSMQGENKKSKKVLVRLLLVTFVRSLAILRLRCSSFRILRYLFSCIYADENKTIDNRFIDIGLGIM
jgi:hypothetical protein